VFAIVMLLSRGCDKPKTLPDTTPWRERVEALTKQNEIKDARIDSLNRLIADLKKDRSKDSARLTNAATVNFKRYKQAVLEVQHLRDSFPQVNALVLAADSALAAKDSLYNQEVSHRMAIEKLYQVEIAELGSKNVVQQQISQLLETKVIDLENQNSKLSKKLERKTRFNRVLIGVGAGLAAAIGILTLTQ
jgi:transcriptional/translational regulatory protein YebC/TACO1